MGRVHLISLETGMFNLEQEPQSPINPIGGHSLLAWLQGVLAPQLELSPPGYEDWGWYSIVRFEGSAYLVGASAFGQPGDPPRVEWLIRVHKQRTLIEKLRGKNRMAPDDLLSAMILVATQNENRFSKVERRVE